MSDGFRPGCDCKTCNETRALNAVKIEPIPARIVGGPIEMRDYDHIRLAVDHTVALPDGTTVQLPAGTLLIMNKPGGSANLSGGTANKNERAIDSRDGSS